MPRTFEEEPLEFESRDQSVYESGTSLTLTDDADFTFDWDIPDVAVDESLGSIVLVERQSIKVFGKRITIVPEIKIDFDTEFTFDFDTAGELGIQFGYRLDTGSVDTDLTYQPEADFSDSLRYAPGAPGELIATSGGDAASGAFDVNPFGLGAYIDILYEFGLLLDASLRLFGANLLPASFPALDFTLPGDIPSLPTDEELTGPSGDPLGNFRLVNVQNDKVQLIEFIFGDLLDDVLPDLPDFISLGFDGNSYLYDLDFFTRLDVSLDVDPYSGEFELKRGDTKSQNTKFSGVDTGAKDDKGKAVKVGPFLTYDVADITFTIPQPRPSDDTLEDGRLEGSDSGNVLRPRVDIDGWLGYAATQATALPIATDYNLKLSDTFTLDLTILDVDAGLPDIRLRQDIEIEPDALQVRLDFTDVDGDPVEVSIVEGGTTSQATFWEGAWEDVPDFAVDLATIVTPTYSTAASLFQETGPEIGAGLEASLGSVRLSVKAPKGTPVVGGDTLFKLKVGPLAKLELTEADILDVFNAENPFFFPIAPTDEDEPVRLGAFGTQTGTPFLLDVDGTATPGLSGVIRRADDGSPLNLSGPVAVDDETFTGDSSISVSEDGTLEIAAADLLANDYDPDAFDTLRLVSIGTPIDAASGLERGTAELRADGTIIFDTAGAFEALGLDASGASTATNGASVELEYTIADAVGRQDTGTVSITVLPKNDLPVVVDDFRQVFVEGGTPQFGDGIFGILNNDVDVDEGDALSTFATGVPTSQGGVVDVFTQGVAYDDVPDAVLALGQGEVLFDTFTYEAADRGTLVGGPTVAGQVSVAFIGVDDGSVADPPQDLVASTGALTLIEGEEAGRFALVLSSAPTGDVTVTLASDPAEAALDRIEVTFTADDWFVPQVVVVTPVDDGLVDGDQTVSVTATVTAADAADDYLGDTAVVDVTVQDAAAIVLSAEALDVTEGEGASTVTVALARPPAAGTQVVLSATSSDAATASVSPATLTFTEDNWDTGIDIAITPVDDDVAEVAAFAEITVALQSTGDPLFEDVEARTVAVEIDDDENTAPRPAAFDAATDEDTAVTIDVPLDGIDPDGDAVTLTAATALQGVVEIVGGQLVYTPAADFFGEDVIQYTVEDAAGGTAQAPVVVTVAPIDDATVAADATIVTAEEEAVSFDLDALITDVDGDDLTVEIVSAIGGTVAQQDDGTYLFTPDDDYFNVEPVLDALGDVLLGDDGEPLYRFVEGVSGAQVVYSVDDGTSEATGAVNVLVTPANDAPVVPVVALATDEDTEIEVDLAGQVLALVTDAEGDAVEIVDVDFAAADAEEDQDLDIDVAAGVDGASAGADTGTSAAFFYDEEAQTVTVDPFADFQSLGEGETGTAVFSYTVEDAFGAQSTGDVEVTVTGVNDLPVAVDDAVVIRVDNQTLVISPPIDLRANDVDPDDETATLGTTLGPDSGSAGLSALGAGVTIGSGGTLFYRPFTLPGGFDSAAVVFDTVDYLVFDASGEIDPLEAVDGGLVSDSLGGVTIVAVGSDVAPGFVLSESAVTVTEQTGYASFLVALMAPPTEEITFAITSSDETEAVTDVAEVTFTPENWATPQAVEVQSVDDREVDGDQSATITVELQPNTDPLYGSVDPVQTVAVTALDNQTPRILTTKPFALTQEGGFDASFGVTLDQAPQGEVVVTVDASDLGDDVVALPTELTFTPDNHDEAQFVTVVAVDDDLLDGPSFGAVVLEVDPDRSSDDYDAALPATVFAAAYDNEVLVEAGPLSVGPSVVGLASGLTVGEGDAGETTTVTLDLARAGNGTDTLASTVSYQVVGAGGAYAAEADDFAGGALPSGTVTFAAGETEALVTFEVAGDDVEELDEYFAIELTAVENAAIGAARLEGSIVNDDGASGIAPDEALTVTLAEESIAESAATTATVARSGDTAEALVVTLGSTDASLATVPGTVTIAAGQSSAEFTVTGTDDDAFEDEIAIAPSTLITAAAAGFKADGATLFVNDDEDGTPDAVDDEATVAKDGEVVLDLLANDSDGDGDELVIEGFTGISDLQGLLVPDGEAFVYSPDGAFDDLAAGETATQTFDYVVTDGTSRDLATVTVTITGGAGGGGGGSTIDVGDAVSEAGEAFVGRLGGGLGIGLAPDALGATVDTGPAAAVGDALAAIVGDDGLAADEVVTILEALLTSGGNRGLPSGVENVGLTSVTEDAVVLSLERSDGAAADTLTVNFEDGLLDDLLGGGQDAGDAKSSYAVIEDGETIIGSSFIGKADRDYNVGGFIRGTRDAETLLRGALDDDFDLVGLAGIDAESFSVAIDRGAAQDTYTFTGDDAASALAAVGGPVINPGNPLDQFVLVPADASGGRTIGIGVSNRYDGVFGGVLKVDEVVEFVQAGATASGVRVIDVGSAVRVDFAGNAGSTDTLILDDGLFTV